MCKAIYCSRQIVWSNKVAQNFTAQLKTRKFIHEPDDYDDLFESTETYSLIQKLAKIHLNPEQLSEFKE